MTGIDLEKVGFWGLLTIYVVRDGLIPIVNKSFPHLLKRNDREQAREDKKLDFEQQMRLREVEALEGIMRFVESTNQFMSSIDKRLDKIEGRPATRKKG